MPSFLRSPSRLRDVALAAGVAVVVVGVAGWLPAWWGIAIVLLGVVAFGLWLYFHPSRWYRRLTGTVLGTWLTCAAVPNIRVFGQGWSGTVAVWVEGGDWAMHLSFAVALVGSLAITAWTDRDRHAVDPACDRLLEAATLWTSGARLLLTTRALPRVLDTRPHVTIGQPIAPGNRVLSGLHRQDGIRLLRQYGVRSGDDAALGQVVEDYAGHAYALSVVGSIVSKQYGGVWEHAVATLGLASAGPGVATDQRVTRLLSQVLEHRQTDRMLLTWVAVSVERPSVALLTDLEQQDEPRLRARLADLQDWHLVDFDGHTAGMHALLQHHIRASLSPAERRQRSHRIAGWLVEQPLAAQPQSLSALQSRLWAVNQMLACDDPEQAFSLLSQQVDPGRQLTLDAWLDAFGHHALRIANYTVFLTGYRRLVEQDGRRELRNALAMVYNNRGLAYAAQGNLAGAIADYGAALALYQGLVEQDGRQELIGYLARTLCNCGLVRLDQQDWTAARADLDAGVQLLHQAVQHGRLDLIPDLARSVGSRVQALEQLGHPTPVVRWLTDLATWLTMHAPHSAGYAVWRHEVARLAEHVAQHQVLLRQAGVDMPQLQQAMAPYLNEAISS